MSTIPISGEGSPPAAPTAEGECITFRGNALSDYAKHGQRGKRRYPLPCRFRSDAGQVFAHRGKVGRVLQMLATMPVGVTQYDTYPWHTRLGASIHLLRESGLSIETIREGEYRHGRYRLLTDGCLIIQAETGEAMQ